MHSLLLQNKVSGIITRSEANMDYSTFLVCVQISVALFWMFGRCPLSGIQKRTRRFGNWVCFPRQSGPLVTANLGRWPCSGMITLMMEAVSTTETLVIIYQTKRRNIPQDSRLRTNRRENLKSHRKPRSLYNHSYTMDKFHKSSNSNCNVLPIRTL
jgi:hypothetical protein